MGTEQWNWRTQQAATLSSNLSQRQFFQGSWRRCLYFLEELTTVLWPGFKKWSLRHLWLFWEMLTPGSTLAGGRGGRLHRPVSWQAKCFVWRCVPDNRVFSECLAAFLKASNSEGAGWENLRLCSGSALWPCEPHSAESAVGRRAAIAAVDERLQPCRNIVVDGVKNTSN